MDTGWTDKKDEDDGHLDQLPFYEVTVYEVLAMSILKWMKNMCLPLHPERNTDNANKQPSQKGFEEPVYILGGVAESDSQT